MRTLAFDGRTGAAGDMLLGALLAAIGAAAAHWPRLATIVAVPLAVGIAVVAHIVIDRLRRAPADPYERQDG